MTQSISIPQTCLTLMTSPRSAFECIRKDGVFWFPLLTLFACSLIGGILYGLTVDVGWLTNHLVETVFEETQSEEAEIFARIFSQKMFLTANLVDSVLSTVIFLPAIALYFLLVSKMMYLEYEFTDWLRYVSWANLPLIITYVGVAMNMLLYPNGRLAPEFADPFSLNSLVLGLSPSDSWISATLLISIPQIWVWINMIIGFRIWTKSTATTSTMVVMLPYLCYALIA